MRCEQFERRLQDVLDNRLNPEIDEPLRDHAGACPECRELLASYDGILTTVASGWVPRGPRRLTGQIIAEWQQTVDYEAQPLPQMRRVRPWQVLAGSFACAAAILIALMPLLQRPGTTDSVLATVPPVVESTAAPMDRANLRPEQLGTVAHRTGRGLALLVLEFPDYETANSGEFDKQVRWLRPVASSLKPLSSVGEPFNVLLRATGTRSSQAHSS
jgi:hypothetical protein